VAGSRIPVPYPMFPIRRGGLFGFLIRIDDRRGVGQRPARRWGSGAWVVPASANGAQLVTKPDGPVRLAPSCRWAAGQCRRVAAGSAGCRETANTPNSAGLQKVLQETLA